MSKTKFKVGDRVVGIGRFDSRNIDGKLGTVVKITNDGIKDIGVEFDEHIDGHSAGCKAKDGHCWWVEEYALKLAEETPKWKVLIMPDGDKTTGRLYENGKVVKSVETKKHPDDEYSIETATKVIMERLFESELLTKFEKGKTYVFRKSLHDRDIPECSYHTWTDKVDGKVVKVNNDYSAEIDYFTICPQWCEEVTEPPKPTYYNGKVVCVEGAYGLTTTGKIYEFVDGKLTYDSGNKSLTPCKNFEDVCKSFTAKFIGVVE